MSVVFRPALQGIVLGRMFRKCMWFDGHVIVHRQREAEPPSWMYWFICHSAFFCPLCSDIIIPGGIALFFELSICADGSLSPSLNGGKERAVESQTKPYLSRTQCYQARRAGDSLMEWPAQCGGETSAISSSRHARLTPAAVSKRTFICVLTNIYCTVYFGVPEIIWESF